MSFLTWRTVSSRQGTHKSVLPVSHGQQLFCSEHFFNILNQHISAIFEKRLWTSVERWPFFWLIIIFMCLNLIIQSALIYCRSASVFAFISETSVIIDTITHDMDVKHAATGWHAVYARKYLGFLVSHTST